MVEIETQAGDTIKVVEISYLGQVELCVADRDGDFAVAVLTAAERAQLRELLL
jgi:hypothetical protein